ncbi:MAG: gliding motility-associated C-terminal domain-containing protein [Bacteroidetes bacterium]|nr:gliding motility-associated C-terminal domain-containing protein [Bacteroidota bacterium]
MRHWFLALILSCCNIAFSQSVAPSVFNTDGGIATTASPTGSVTVYYNIGEPVYTDVQNATSTARFTQGFLQPDIIGLGVLQINTYTTAMTCASANDASIVLNVNGSNVPYIYKWYKNGVLLSDTSSSLLNLAVGNYSYAVSDSKGNTRTGATEVKRGEGTCKVVIHNGISPNNDGHNDFFHIEHIEDYPDNSVSIYSRWGSLIWDKSGYDNASVVWRGEDAKGTMLASGTYFFIVIIDGHKTTGWVELMR